MSFYEIKPIKVGSLTYTSSVPTFSIDLVSRDEIVYFENDRYPELMVTEQLKNKLLSENLTGFTFLEFNKMFSVEHDMEHPNKKLPKWYRMTILRQNKDIQTDFYLTDDNKMIINSKSKNFLMENARLKRCTFDKIRHDKLETNNSTDMEEEKPIFKQEKEKPLIGILAIILIVAVIGYLVFN